MNFALARKNYKGPINKLAYFGMLGDVLVIGGLYALYKERQRRQEACKEEVKAAARQALIDGAPPKLSETDYNKLSPYTPVPYHMNKQVKYKHAHIDVVDYLDEKNKLNLENFYLRDYHDSYDKTGRDLYTINYQDPYGLHHKH